LNTAKLVWATPEGDALIAKMARVSNPANQNNPDSARLIRYLIQHKHWSPFEMASMCVEIETTRDIGRQILRHRSLTAQEFSQRYADVNAIGAKPVQRECRLQDVENRQNSLDCDDESLADWWAWAQYQAGGFARDLYADALKKGIAKEQARALLPEGLTPSRMYVSGTVRSWLHYCDLRCGPETQKEHRQVAEACRDLLYESFPNVARAMWGPRVG
jgi:thymidylate synthase (FAD)